MACGNCDKKKDQGYVEQMATRFAEATGNPQQVFIHTTYQGDIFDFEPLGIQREKVIKIIRIEEGKYTVISTQ